MMLEPRNLSLGRCPAALIVMLSLCLAAYGSPKYKVLHDFTGGTDGAGNTGVIVDSAGNLFAASGQGGTGNCGYSQSCGLILELTPDGNGEWSETVLYNFQDGRDAANPNSPLTLDASGDLYGTTNSGGTRGGGTVFELTPGATGWAMTVLHSFCNQEGCVGLPQAGVAMDQAGNLFGTTPELPHGGAAFKLAPRPGGWQQTTLHTFGVKKGDGDEPHADLILDATGSLYGTTAGGGTYGGGTVYEIRPGLSGWHETVLHSFSVNYKDGHTPGWGALLMDTSGSLYGTTAGGGCCGGVVYKLSPSSGGHWKETILYEFQGGANGYEPNAGVVMGKAGVLYGTTDYGGSGCGVIYKLAPEPKGKWKYAVLHTFEGADGCIPEGNLVLDPKGNLYGGTVLGGTKGYGVVFELTP